MYSRPNNPRLRMRAVSAAVLLLLLAACAPSNATPTLSVDAIYTSAYQTMLAGQATQLALTPPTETPTATMLPTLPPLPSPAVTFAFTTPTAGSIVTGGGGHACDSSAFVADVTIPDNTVIEAGKRFVKTWTLLNNGTCTWDSTYKLALQSGDGMGGSTTTVPGTVSPGSSLNISVNLTAPDTTGTYKGIWRLQNGANQFFGDTPWVQIKVGTGATSTVGPSPTAGPSPTRNTTGPYTISGTVGIAGNFTIEFSDESSTPTVNYVYADTGFSSYSFTVPGGWHGTITPRKGVWQFVPASKSFSNVREDKPNTNFTVGNTPSASATPTP